MKYEEFPLQYYFRDDPWKVLVCCTLMSQTRGTFVKTIIDRVFELCPDPSTMLDKLRELKEIIDPTGLAQHKMRCLELLSIDLLGRPTRAEIAEGNICGNKLRGVGKYGIDSVKIFCLGDLECCPADKILVRWVDFKKGLREWEEV
jgi:endonuclease III